VATNASNSPLPVCVDKDGLVIKVAAVLPFLHAVASMVMAPHADETASATDLEFGMSVAGGLVYNSAK
jgi:hypothetical protein